MPPIADSPIAHCPRISLRSLMLTPRFPVFLRQMVVAWGVLLVGLSPAVAQVAVSTLAGSSPAIASGNVNATGTAAQTDP